MGLGKTVEMVGCILANSWTSRGDFPDHHVQDVMQREAEPSEGQEDEEKRPTTENESGQLDCHVSSFSLVSWNVARCPWIELDIVLGRTDI